MNIVVAGAGSAGISAARSGRASGADVTLLDRSSSVGPSKSLLPLLLTGEVDEEKVSAADQKSLDRTKGIQVKLEETVRNVAPSEGVLETSSGRLKFDSLVIAIGSSQVVDPFKGISKKNVYVLKEVHDYVSLRENLKNLSRIALVGSSPLALSVAEVLAKKGLKVYILSASGPLSGQYSGSIHNTIAKRLETSGMTVVTGSIEAVAGMRGVEAVVSNGSVFPCDGVVAFPRSMPNLLPIELRRGRAGAILVDARMKTSVEKMFAAGDCAEMRFKSSSLPVRLQSSARIMGEVAGINAAGGDAVARISGVVCHTFFGLELCSGGFSLKEACAAGLDAVESSGNFSGREEIFGEESAECSIVYDRVTGEVYGIQVAGWRALAQSDLVSVAFAMNLTLRDLAYLDSAYVPGLTSDESPITLTARKALSMVVGKLKRGEAPRSGH